MTDFATPADVEAVWRPLTLAEAAAAEALLEVASAIIRSRFADIDARIASGALSPVLARHVAVMMVRRYLDGRSPDAPIQERIGEAARQWAAGQVSDLELTTADAGLLAAAGRGMPRTINLGLGISPP